MKVVVDPAAHKCPTCDSPAVKATQGPRYIVFTCSTDPKHTWPDYLPLETVENE